MLSNPKFLSISLKVNFLKFGIVSFYKFIKFSNSKFATFPDPILDYFNQPINYFCYFNFHFAKLPSAQKNSKKKEKKRF